jgi:uncharacterized protein YaeQ
MTFVAAFYNFSIELNNSDSNTFVAFRLKIPRHELESREHFYARLITYLHSYQEGIAFCEVGTSPKLPTLWRRDAIGSVLLWVHVGAPEKRTLELSLKQHPLAEHRVYFYDQDDIARFCHHLRGSKTNWVKDVQFYLIDGDLLRTLAAEEETSPQWSVSFIDGRMYLSVDGRDLESTLLTVDIWEAFQQSLTSADSLTPR